MKKIASCLIFSFILVGSMSSGSRCATNTDYQSTPPFLSGRVTPNVLLLIDNSASMYDPAYVDSGGDYCFDDTYVDTTDYAGYFDGETYYKYDLAVGQFESTTQAEAAALCAGATGTKYGNTYVCISVDKSQDPDEVTAFVARGNFLNWAAASKLDIEKKILTGGKYEATGTYGAPNGRLVMESRGCLNKRLVKQVDVTDGFTTHKLALAIRAPKEESFPAWANNTAYAVGDIVMDVLDLYIATSAGTSNGNGVVDDTGVTWAAYTLSRWTDGATYPANSIVSDNNKMYITATGGTASGTGVSDDTGITDWVSYNVTQIEIFPVTESGFDNSGCQAAVEELGKASPNQGQLMIYIGSCMGYSGGGGQSEEADSNGAFNHSIHNCWYRAQHGSWPPGAGPTQSVKNDCERIYDTWGTDSWDITTDDQGYVCYGAWDTDSANSPDVPPTGYVGRCWSPGVGSMQCTQWKNPDKCLPYVAPHAECCKKWEWVGTSAPGWDAAGYADVDTCIETALMDYCSLLAIPEVVDPTDQAGETGEFWNIPAVLIDSGAVAQIGEPLVVFKGYIKQATAPTGLVQEFDHEMRLGAMSFNDNGAKSECSQPDPYILYDCSDASNRDGGKILSYNGYQLVIDQGDDHTTKLVAALNEIKATSWTPIAEAVYNAIGYYGQDSNVRLDTNDFPIGTDPVTAWCQYNNILIITDGASTADLASAVSAFTASAGKNDGSDGDPAQCGSLSGSPLLDDLTYYAKHGSVTDLYTTPQLDGYDKRNISTHIVVAGTLRVTGTDECSPDVLLANAASNAGTSLYQATNPSQLEDKIREAFVSILGDASSGTAASVVSASRRGEGALYQAVFFQSYTDDNGTEINWIGQLHGLFVDEHGNMREDTNQNATLDMTSDRIIEYYFDETDSRTKARRDTDTDGNGEADGSPASIELSEIEYIWEAGKELAERDPGTRYIYTWIDDDDSGTAEWSVEKTEFKDTNKTTMQPYLGQSAVADAEKLINYIRGTDQVGYRSRTIDVDGTNRVWMLGDIVYSTPTVVGKPKENYGLLYGDTTYKTFKNQYNDRRHVIYVGANDGMLHAFNAGFYNEANSAFETGTSTPSYSTAVPSLGEELWAFIPYNLLPHLQWLASETYSHVYYVDLKPKAIDAQIFSADATHPGGWGTVLVCGMRLGGGTIALSESDVNYDWDGDSTIEAGVSKTFRSAYFAFDITDPEAAPTLLWEFTDANLRFTTSYPAVVSIDRTTIPDTWAIAFGSGPTDHRHGTSDQTARTYVLNLKTGVQIGSCLNTGGSNTFMGDPISVDIDISSTQCSEASCTYSPDIAYIGNSEGKFYRITDITSSSAGTLTTFLDLGGANKPIISTPSAAQDNDGRLWLYFGTGRFLAEADKTTTYAQTLVGIKEPISDYSDPTSLSYAEVANTNVLNVTDYVVYEGGYVDVNHNQIYEVGTDTTFDSLITDIKQTTDDTDTPKHYDGWTLDLTAGKRCMTKPTILGGIVTFTTFTPDDAECSFQGDNYLYALYYKTGTAYCGVVLEYGDKEMVAEGVTLKEIKRSKHLGEGVSTTPSLHVGKKGAKAFVQSSTGEIVVIDEENLPEGYRSQPLHWILTGD